MHMFFVGGKHVVLLTGVGVHHHPLRVPRISQFLINRTTCLFRAKVPSHTWCPLWGEIFVKRIRFDILSIVCFDGGMDSRFQNELDWTYCLWNYFLIFLLAKMFYVFCHMNVTLGIWTKITVENKVRHIYVF